MKKFYTLLIAILLVTTGFSQVTSPENQVLIAPSRTETGFDFLESYLEANDAKIVQHYNQLGWCLVDLPSGQTQDDFIAKTKDLWFIERVYKNEYMEYSRDIIPNDSQFGSQWHLRQLSDKDLDADLAWDSIPMNNAPTTVAVFDGGIDISHEDLIGNIVTPFNAVTNSFSNGELVDVVNDRHGTACSGTIAAIVGNGIGVASVGYNKVKVMPINIMTSITSGGQFGTSASIQVNAINAAIAQGCVAISMSYGGGSYSQAVNDALIVAKTQAREGKGIFICASTGNGYSGTITQYPASYSAVYGIGATTSADLRAGFSNFGNIVDISAPGASILTTDLSGALGYNGGNYASVSGTSFSCPITAAAGALLMCRNRDLTESQVMNILASTAEKVGGYIYAFNSSYPLSTRSVELGYGRINLFEAMKATPLVGNPIITPPTQQHDIVLVGGIVSTAAPALGSTITITVQQKTNAPALDEITPKVQYRFSLDNIWSADDIIIGIDTSTIGNGVESQIETINYAIPANSPTGARWILIRANFDNAITEATAVNNTISIPIAVFNPAAGGLDLSVSWTRATLVTCNNTTGSGTVWTFRNTGQIPVTAFSYRLRWESCPIPGAPSWYNCNSVSSSNITPQFLGTVLQPNQSAGTWTSNICIGTCGPGFTVIPLGETRNLIVEITSVNGLPVDDFTGNNIATLPITRIACTNSVGIVGDDANEAVGNRYVEVEEPKILIFTSTGALLDATDIQYLASGIYIIKYVFSDHIVTERIFKP